LFFLRSADSSSHQATVGVSAAPPVGSIVDRIIRSERWENPPSSAHLLAKGRFILIAFSSAGETNAACPRRRRRFEFLRRFKWRLPCFRRKTRPLPVTLNLLATPFRVLLFPAILAIGRPQ